MLLSELVQMNCVSSERVINILEENLLTWSDLELAAKCSKGCTPKHFWQSFRFLRNFSKAKLLLLVTDTSLRIGSNELCLLCKGDKYMRGKFLYLKRSSIGSKRFRRVHPEPFWKIFNFLRTFSIAQNFISYDQSFCLNWLKRTVSPLETWPIS